MLPRQGKTKVVHHHQSIIIRNVEEAYLRKKIKTMNMKMTVNSQLPTIESENKVSKQTEQGQNYRYGDHLVGYQLGEGRGRMGERCRE